MDELDLIRAFRAGEAAPDPDARAAARRRLVAHLQPQQSRRRRRPLLLSAAAAAAAAVAVLALMPGEAPPTVLERAYAAASQSSIYHYVVTTQELEGPQRRPVPDTQGSREGWIDPSTGQIHEIHANGDEWVTDGSRRLMYTRFNDSIIDFPEPAPGGREQAPDDVLGALTRSFRAGELRDEGPDTLDGRPVRRLVAINADRTWRQTFLVDVDTYLPVMFRTETGEHVRAGTQIPPDQRIIEERFETFERLPEGTDRAVLDMRPHPGAKDQTRTGRTRRS